MMSLKRLVLPINLYACIHPKTSGQEKIIPIRFVSAFTLLILASDLRSQDTDDHGGLGFPAAAVCPLHQQRAVRHSPQHGAQEVDPWFCTAPEGETG